MDNYFYGLSDEPEEIEVGVEPTVNSYEEMINAIVIGVPDPRLLQDPE